MKIFSVYKLLLQRNRWWIFFILILAFIWTFVGYFIALTFPDSVPNFIESFGETLDEALGEVTPAPTWEFAYALFEQNGTAAGLDLLLGIILGIVPLLSIILNFFALGFLAGPVFNDISGVVTISPGLFVLAIAPHGIFELPALLLAAAFGFRIGWHWLLPAAEGKRKQTLKESFRDALIALPFIVLLLIIAALVEAFVTFNLVN